MTNTVDRLTAIIAIELSRPQGSISRDSRFIEDLEADSIDTANILSAIQHEFQIQIRFEDVEEITTVDELASLIESQLRKKKT